MLADFFDRPTTPFDFAQSSLFRKRRDKGWGTTRLRNTPTCDLPLPNRE